MKRWLFLFLYLPILLQASWEDLFSEDENPGLFHHVQVISGHLNFSLQEVVQGAIPIPLMRAYTSGGALEKDSGDNDLLLHNLHKGWMVQGGWSFLAHTDLFLMPGHDRKGFKAYLADPGGSVLTYAYSHHEDKRFLFFKPAGSFASLSGKLGAKNNPQNNLLRLDLKKGIAVLFLPDGGTREYQGIHWSRDRGFDPRDQCYYRLVKEVLPSQHQFHYQYDKRSHLSQITSTNPTGDKLYATVNFTLSTSPLRLCARTSDGKEFYYQSLEAGDREYLHRMESPNSPLEIAGFVPGRKGIGHRMHAMNIGGREQFRAYYHLPSNKREEKDWVNKPHHVPFFIDKVKTIEEPVGPNGEMATVATFCYEPHCTEVRDAENLMIRYRHDGDKLNQIEYFDEKDQLSSIQKFYWEGSRLRCKALLNAQGKPLLAKTFAYDEIGNVLEEGLWGDLTGSDAILRLDEKGNPTGEGCRKWYTYLPHFNLPLLEKEEDGLTYKYEYLPGTNLLSAKFTCEGECIAKREFWGYNNDHIRIYEIVDDGSSTDRNDCSHVTERHKKDYVLDPGSGLPVEIREIYWDPRSGHDQLLYCVHLTYSKSKQVLAEDVYDVKGVHRYTLHTEYDAYGRVIRKTTPLGYAITYCYDTLGNLASSKEIGSEKRFGYDAAGRQTVCEDLLIGTSTYTTYDTKGRTLSQTDARGNVTYHLYDGFGRCVQTQFPESIDETDSSYIPTVHFSYDLQGNFASTQMPNGETTQTFYNTYRKPMRIIRPDGSEIRHLYNKNGSLARTIHPDGSEEHFTYDHFLRMTSKQLYSRDRTLLSCESWQYSAFQLISHTDVRGLTTKFIYDGAGRKIEERAEGHITTYQYDALGFLERTDNGIVAHIEIHDLPGRTIEQWEEDPAGRIENWMAFTYDEHNLKKEARRRTSQGEAHDLFVHEAAHHLVHHTDPEGNITQWIYDETFQNDLGQYVLQKTTIDALGHRTLETQDAAGRLVASEKQDSAGCTLSKDAFFYDRSGNRAKRTTTVYSENRIIRQTTSSWVYDSMGRVIEEIEADKKVTQFAYDAKGHLIYKRLPSGIVFTYVYDGADRLLELQSSDGSVHYQYFYTQGPDPICIFDCIHQLTLERTCDLFGRVLHERGAFTLDWTYDVQGRCTAFTLPDDSSIAYVYSGAHLASVERHTETHNYAHHYLDFDENGHVIKEQLIGSLGSIQTVHDILERPCKQSSSYLHHTITYGPTGLITSAHNSLFGKKNYEHDGLSQLKKENDLAYFFDSLGNPTDCKIGACNEILSASQAIFSYDLDGNPIERIENGQTTRYRYDALGRLIEIIEPGQTTHYAYDPLSRLLSKETPNDKVFFLYDRDKEIGTINEQGQICELKILGLGLKGDIGAAIALELRGALFAPLHDLGGNLIALLNLRGQIVESYDMDAFGNEHSKATSINPWHFCSKRNLGQLVFFGVRFYDPTIKRWLTPDPSGFADGPNLYLYVCNNPLRRLDLFGLFSEDRFGVPVRIEVPLELISRYPYLTSFRVPGSINGTHVDYFLSCGHWHQIQFTPEEVCAGKLNLFDHFNELIPSSGKAFGLVTVGNGINTSFEEFKGMCNAVADRVGGTLLIGLHNPTYTFIPDIIRTYIERWNVQRTSSVCQAQQFLSVSAGSLHKINPEAFWLYIAHSENGVISKRAIEGLSAGDKRLLQKAFYMYAVGPADPLSRDMGQSIVNVYSDKDYVTKRFAEPYLHDDDFDIQFIRCKTPRSERSLWIADHGFMAPTYQGAWSGHIQKLQDKIPFYQGDKHEQTR